MLFTKSFKPLAFSLLLLITVVINSCRKRDLITPPIKEKFSVQEAKDWFYGSFVKTEEYKNLNKSSLDRKSSKSISTFSDLFDNGKIPTQKYPSWKMAKHDDKKKYSVIEMPYAAENKYFEIKNNVHTDAEKRKLAHYTLTNAIIVKDSKGNIFPRIVHITPDSQYLRKENFDISNNGIVNMDNDFSGYVNIYRWNGEGLKKFYFKNGKIEKAFLVRNSTNSNVVSSNFKKKHQAKNNQIVANDGGGECYELWCPSDIVALLGDEPFNCHQWGDCDESQKVPIQVPCPDEVEVPTPEDPSDPIDPNDPTDPSNPSDPSDPSDPNDPFNPYNPGDPSYGGGDPTNPDPSDPYNPYDPFDPNFGMDPACYFFGDCVFDPNYSSPLPQFPESNNPYGLTFQEKFLINQLYLEDDDVSGNMNLSCYGTRLRGNINFNGTLEHYLIQQDYIDRHANSFYEYSIPQSSVSGTGFRGRVDIANLNTLELFEIKPDKPEGRSAGIVEIQIYLDKAKQFCNSSFIEGVAYPTRILPYPKSKTQVLQARLTAPGVIGYLAVDKTSNPITVPFPAPLPSNLLVKLKILFQALLANQNDMYEKIWVYLKNNPDLANAIKNSLIGVAVGVMVATIVEDILTGGLGILDDIACAKIAYNLIRVAIRIP